MRALVRAMAEVGAFGRDMIFGYSHLDIINAAEVIDMSHEKESVQGENNMILAQDIAYRSF